MPPWPRWYVGRESIGRFFAWAWTRHDRLRFVPTAANRQPAFAVYVRGPDGPELRAHTIQVLSLRDGAIGALVFFRDTRLFAAFGLPAVLPASPD